MKNAIHCMSVNGYIFFLMIQSLSIFLWNSKPKYKLYSHSILPCHWFYPYFEFRLNFSNSLFIFYKEINEKFHIVCKKVFMILSIQLWTVNEISNFQHLLSDSFNLIISEKICFFNFETYNILKVYKVERSLQIKFYFIAKLF